MNDIGIVRVASPCLDQAMSIARVIRNTSGSNVHIRGLTLPGEIRPVHRGPFDSFTARRWAIYQDQSLLEVPRPQRFWNVGT